MELRSGSAREVQDDGQLVLEAVVRESCTGWRSATSRPTAALDASRWNNPLLLIGPNNCGKTTALHAIGLWSIAMLTWQQEPKDSNTKQSTGKPLNRLRSRLPPTLHLDHDATASRKP
jgi:hypothetical protein